ncbi:MAG TPA: FGGY family carbohydrate kinase [Trebonia sp.]|nr:FGGY family carbohydrate kinase [Trebonia sp.]
MATLVLGIDVGTTSTKVVLADPTVGVLAQASEPVALSSPHPGWAEADPAQWWANLASLVPAVLGKSVTAADIAAVATTGMVPAVVLVDDAGRPLRSAILQNDARATAEIRELGAALPDLDFVARTGSALTQQSVGPTLLWLARHEPDAWASAATVQGSYDWLASRLGAAPHVERNWALESGLFELEKHGALTPLQPMRDALARLARIKPDVIPPVADPGTVIGEVSRSAAAETGLRPGTPIVAGGADHVLSAYAAGLASPGDWLVKLGGAGDILVVSGHPLVDERLYLDAHPVAGLWLPNGCMATSGSLIRWFQSVSASASSGPAPVAELEAEALAATPAELICLPYFLGEKSPLHDPDLRGAFLGLHLGHTRGDMYRAILEGIAYGFRHHAEIFTERKVALRSSARVSNGGSKSLVWKQILADALGVALEPVLDHPGAALGAALAAAVGTAGAPTPQAWAAAASVPGLVTIGAPIEPDPAHAGRYAEAYRLYRDAGAALTPISHQLARRSMS